MEFFSFLTAISQYTPAAFPLNNQRRIIPPFWADVNTNIGGSISYRQTTDPVLMQRATEDVSRAFLSHQRFRATWSFIATWDRVAFHGVGASGKSKSIYSWVARDVTFFDSHDLTLSTKLKVYVQCLTPLLTYGCETWTLYRYNINQLRTVQQWHLRKILRIKWSDYVSNEEVLRRADAEDIEITLIKSRKRWLGHVSRMDDDSPVKALMYGKLDKGTRPVGRPKLRYKDTCKSVLKSGRFLDRWQDLVVDRPLWRRTIGNVCGIVNANRTATYQRQKEHRAQKKAKSGN
ncbi:uncharacterized protein LOC122950060 [Acropora millepora]|uniref:uncharacterized protein LOC122950060 n=1 Tax=Acropora millepora TaxID=45264 RepID=UPI001CF21532|nr:uncharacterized protein LOC122950060 [Acropora millepora]